MPWLAIKRHDSWAELDEPRVYATRTRAERDVHEYALSRGVIIKDGKPFIAMYEGKDEEMGFDCVDGTLYDGAIILSFSIVDGPRGHVEEVEVVST